MKNGGLILWNAVAICEMFKTSLAYGKTLCERRFGEPFEGPVVPFGSMLENRPVSAKDQSRLHQFGKKVLLGMLLGYAFIAERVRKGDILVADIEELGNDGRMGNPCSKAQCKRSIDATKE